MKTIVCVGRRMKVVKGHNGALMSPELVARIDERFAAKDANCRHLGRMVVERDRLDREIGIDPDWLNLFGGSGRRR
jgi:hypothetical protein